MGVGFHTDQLTRYPIDAVLISLLIGPVNILHGHSVVENPLLLVSKVSEAVPLAADLVHFSFHVPQQPRTPYRGGSRGSG